MAAIEVIAEGPAPTLQQTALVLNDRRLDMLQAFFGGWVVLALFTFLLLWGIVVKACQWDKAPSEQLKGIKELED